MEGKEKEVEGNLEFTNCCIAWFPVYPFKLISYGL